MASPATDRPARDSGESWAAYWQNNNLRPALEGRAVRSTDAEEYATFREPLSRVEDLVGTSEATQHGITVRGLSVGVEQNFQYFILDPEGSISLSSLLRDKHPEHIFLHGDIRPPGEPTDHPQRLGEEHQGDPADDYEDAAEEPLGGSGNVTPTSVSRDGDGLRATVEYFQNQEREAALTIQGLENRLRTQRQEYNSLTQQSTAYAQQATRSAAENRELTNRIQELERRLAGMPRDQPPRLTSSGGASPYQGLAGPSSPDGGPTGLRDTSGRVHLTRARPPPLEGIPGQAGEVAVPGSSASSGGATSGLSPDLLQVLDLLRGNRAYPRYGAADRAVKLMPLIRVRLNTDDLRQKEGKGLAHLTNWMDDIEKYVPDQEVRMWVASYTMDSTLVRQLGLSRTEELRTLPWEELKTRLRAQLPRENGQQMLRQIMETLMTDKDDVISFATKQTSRYQDACELFGIPKLNRSLSDVLAHTITANMAEHGKEADKDDLRRDPHRTLTRMQEEFADKDFYQSVFPAGIGPRKPTAARQVAYSGPATSSSWSAVQTEQWPNQVSYANNRPSHSSPSGRDPPFSAGAGGTNSTPAGQSTQRSEAPAAAQAPRNPPANRGGGRSRRSE